MASFDYTTARFTQSDDDQWKLVRDWSEHPPTPAELEALYAHTLQLDRIVAAFVHHFVAGDITTADARRMLIGIRRGVRWWGLSGRGES